MKPFETTQGPKHECRLKLIEATTDVRTEDAPRILTLPSREHICYDLFKEQFPTSTVVCLEQQADIARSLNNQGITTENVGTTTYLKSYQPWQQPFTCLFLDYYSFLHKSIIEDLTIVASKPNIIGKDWTAVGVTLSKSIRGGKDQIEEILDAGLRTRQDEVIKCDLNLVSGYIAAEVFKDYRVKTFYKTEYKASEASAMMWFMVFLLKRK